MNCFFFVCAASLFPSLRGAKALVPERRGNLVLCPADIHICRPVFAPGQTGFHGGACGHTP
ncbi:MAG: hypothetical protein KAW46_00645, partial [candidate division Zixibacteria bacterium]|nr:hypothetical protein [candidate division Zixibacteria bacterium]